MADLIDRLNAEGWNGVDPTSGNVLCTEAANALVELGRRYQILADIRRCEFASRIFASPVMLFDNTTPAQFAVRQADDLIAELEKKRDG